jgi:hypothetical protein
VKDGTVVTQGKDYERTTVFRLPVPCYVPSSGSRILTEKNMNQTREGTGSKGQGRDFNQQHYWLKSGKEKIIGN